MIPLAAYVDVENRLALGIEPVDALRESRVPPPLLALRERLPAEEVLDRLVAERIPLTRELPALRRLESCRFTLFETELRTTDPWVDFRLVEGRGLYPRRRFVPRRFRYPLGAAAIPLSNRIRRPALFPGAEYPIHESATVLRGRAVRDGAPMRWARVEALLPAGDGSCPDSAPETVLAVAHGDDRGDFLLVLPTNTFGPGALRLTVTVCVRVWGPEPVPIASERIRSIDPHWDLPREALPLTAAGELAAGGRTLPAGYIRDTTRKVTLRLGATTSDPNPYLVL
ncbi:MAG TPA: hypothetical protein VMN39_09990 [Longimicrobiaceae bacterium]|nr:hypothetical protein [Longimicrobiaceae bacterium]